MNMLCSVGGHLLLVIPFTCAWSNIWAVLSHTVWRTARAGRTWETFCYSSLTNIHSLLHWLSCTALGSAAHLTVITAMVTGLSGQTMFPRPVLYDFLHFQHLYFRSDSFRNSCELAKSGFLLEKGNKQNSNNKKDNIILSLSQIWKVHMATIQVQNNAPNVVWC